MGLLELQSYRSKGINAYAVPLLGLSYEQNAMDYGKPATDEDKKLAHRNKSHTVLIDLSIPKFKDSYLMYKEARGHKAVYGWLGIKGSEITTGYDSEDEYSIARVATMLDLCELGGESEKQISYANSIRAKAIIYLECYEGLDSRFHQDYLNSNNTARGWIEEYGTNKPSTIAAMIRSKLNE